MKNHLWGLFFIFFFLISCSEAKVSKANYINMMSDMACAGVSERSRAGDEIFSKYGVTRPDVMLFRETTDRETLNDLQIRIDQLVSACKGAIPSP